MDTNTINTNQAAPTTNTPVIDLTSGLTDAEKHNLNEFVKDNTGVVGENLAKVIIHQAGGWRRFTYLAPEVSNLGIEDGFKGFDIPYQIQAMFFAHKDSFIAFGNAIAWEYDCDNVYDLTAKFVSGEEPYSDEQISFVYDDAVNGGHVDDVECFNNVIQWIVWNAAQYVYDHYIVFAKWIADGRPSELPVLDGLATQNDATTNT